MGAQLKPPQHGGVERWWFWFWFSPGVRDQLYRSNLWLVFFLFFFFPLAKLWKRGQAPMQNSHTRGGKSIDDDFDDNGDDIEDGWWWEWWRNKKNSQLTSFSEKMNVKRVLVPDYIQLKKIKTCDLPFNFQLTSIFFQIFHIFQIKIVRIPSRALFLARIFFFFFFFLKKDDVCHNCFQ